MAYTDIDKSDDYFNIVLYTGTQTITNIDVGFQPDFVWIKSRSNTQVHALFDAVRGTSIGALQSNATASENANQKLVAYTSTGFTLPSVNYEWTNTTGWTFASWNWLASNTTASNTQGSIASTVSANTTSGFSIVSYTGNGSSAQTVGHGLGVAPKMVIVKRRDGTDDWYVNHTSASATAGSYLKLNNTQAVITGSAARWNNTNPTSTVFAIGDDSGLNASGGTYIGYCFADVKGFSKLGSYTGNGSTDGTFVYTGFKPSFVIIKCSSSGSTQWRMFDVKRDTYNPMDKEISANTDDAESSPSRYHDFLSNGFKMRDTNVNTNGSGSSYIYMAFAENPFVTSTGIPACAR